MNRNASYLHTKIVCILNGMRAFERRKQSGMKVHYPIRESIEDFCGNHTHVTGHNHVFSTSFLQGISNTLVSRRSVGIRLAIHHQDGNSCLFGTFNAKGVRTRRNNQADFRTERAFFNMVDERLEVRAATADQNADVQRFLHLSNHALPFVARQGVEKTPSFVATAMNVPIDAPKLEKNPSTCIDRHQHKARLVA